MSIFSDLGVFYLKNDFFTPQKCLQITYTLLYSTIQWYRWFPDTSRVLDCLCWRGEDRRMSLECLDWDRKMARGAILGRIGILAREEVWEIPLRVL